ncbi:DegV family protein [Ohessyouella blattaphilus]|uniref:DegV family protein n=1 Tax=Ohessyouella blattaphilus TaxID=2949333 RepID=A0ABT1ED84_9FIRM|nr:DegV family protein [Ohessyouella blattaphilus]MCP1108653.1 DegV family protein [Ohessyouella blattaphilus]MCR8562047.1 DegV family protein [Ohessyouella blattaphilus]
MEYKIIIDSCGELTSEMKASGIYTSIPLYITVGERNMVDDETFDQQEFLRAAAATKECPRSSCPSPDQYLESYRGNEKRVYGVTLSANLSGSYNSAMLAKTMMEEQEPDKQVYIFDSRSASVAQTLIGLKIRECEEKGLSFEEVVTEVEAYIEGQNTYFVLEDLETLRKNGRLTGLKMLVASALNIKPVCGATAEGTIFQLGQGRGINKALQKMVQYLTTEVINPTEKVLAISHCNCLERAESVKKMILEKVAVKEVIILDTRGISTMYASDGGIIAVV